MRSVVRAFLFIASSAVLALLLLALQAPLEPDRKPASALPSGLKDALEQALVKQQVREEILQDSINASLAFQQGAGAEPELSCALVKDECRLFLRWQVMGHPLVARVDFTVRREGGVYVTEVLRGAYGRLEVPRGFLVPLRPVLQALKGQHETELAALFAMPRFHFAEQKLVLAPRF